MGRENERSKARSCPTALLVLPDSAASCFSGRSQSRYGIPLKAQNRKNAQNGPQTQSPLECGDLSPLSFSFRAPSVQTEDYPKIATSSKRKR